MLWLGLAAGCAGWFEHDKTSGSYSTPADTTPTWVLVAVYPPIAPTDPLIVLLDDPTVPNEPVVEGPDGAIVEVVPIDDGQGGSHDGWVAVGGWAPGEYRITQVGAVEVHQQRFTVPELGVGGPDASALVGRAWQVTDAVARSGLQDFALSQGDAVVTIESVDGDQAQFAAVVYVDRQPCVVLRDVATYDAATGHLAWSLDELQVATSGDDDPPIEVRELWGELWLTTDGATGAGQGHFVVDTRYVFDDDEDGVCSLLGTFGVTCQECPDGAPLCRDEDIYQIQLVEVDPLDASNLPVCGFDRVLAETPEIGPIGCDFHLPRDSGCDCATSQPRLGMPLLLAVVAGVRRRRTT